MAETEHRGVGHKYRYVDCWMMVYSVKAGKQIFDIVCFSIYFCAIDIAFLGHFQNGS